MANREACELYIEQEIKEALAQGKKPWSIGKELSKWVERLFEVNISPNTLRMRAERVGNKDVCTFVQKESNTSTETNTYKPIHTPTSVTYPTTERGGAREGAGRPPKVEHVSNALRFAQMAIAQLDSILPNDPQKNAALTQVIEYCQARKENDND